MPEPVLAVTGLFAGYGRGDIVHGAALEVGPQEIVTIIGPNGAGKSTLLKAIAGVVRPRAGRVMVGARDLSGLAASEVARAGVAYVPQEANVFRTMTVAENLELGAWTDRSQYRERLGMVEGIFPVLRDKARVRAGLLSGGQRQMVAFAMALMVKPIVLLLDEPSAGLAPAMVDQMLATIEAVNGAGVAILMVEQNAKQALAVSHRGIVMSGGRVATEGAAATLAADRAIGELYLGVEA